MKKFVALTAMTLMVVACGHDSSYAGDSEDYPIASDPSQGEADDDALSEPVQYSSSYGAEDEEFDEDAAREQAEEELAEETYVGIGTPYGCTEDCGGHEAGYSYQAQKGYDTSYISSDSVSFDQGRQAYDEAVEERVDELRQGFEEEQGY